MLRRKGEKKALKAELEREMAVKLREQKEWMRSFMWVQFKQMAKMRDEAVEREKRLWGKWESKVGGDLEQIEKKAAAGGRRGRRIAKDLISRTSYLNMSHQ